MSIHKGPGRLCKCEALTRLCLLEGVLRERGSTRGRLLFVWAMSTEATADADSAQSVSSQRHAQLQSWSSRKQGYQSSRLHHGVSSHMFKTEASMMTRDVDEFAKVVSVATHGTTQGCVSSDQQRRLVLSVNVGAVLPSEVAVASSSPTSVVSTRKREEDNDAPETPTKRTKTKDGWFTSVRNALTTRSSKDVDSNTLLFQQSSFGTTLKLFAESAAGKGVDIPTMHRIRTAMCGLKELRGPSGEVVVESTALHTRGGERNVVVLLVRIAAGTPVSILQLRTAVGGSVWSDGTFRTITASEGNNLNSSLPTAKWQTHIAATQDLSPLVIGFAMPYTLLEQPVESNTSEK